MRSLSAAEILEAWERGSAQSPHRRALELLSHVYPEATANSLSGLSIGQRDAELLALRERTFGPEMAAMAVCPQCGRQSDITLNTAEMRFIAIPEPVQTMELTMAGYDLRFRLPNSDDLVALTTSDYDECRKQLLGRCLLSLQYDGAPGALSELPDEVVDAVSEQMAKADPLADIQLALSCPFCDLGWKATFDIVSFLWREIEALAARLLRDVHALASAYGWHERDILALTPLRRQFYLALIGI
jgi:hypothetical protein